MEKFQKLSRAEMRNVKGGVDAPPGGGGGNTYCYKCCSDLTLKTCGQCNSSGNGQCQGNGVAVGCYCG